jgi:hypothetical protein
MQTRLVLSHGIWLAISSSALCFACSAWAQGMPEKAFESEKFCGLGHVLANHLDRRRAVAAD